MSEGTADDRRGSTSGEPQEASGGEKAGAVGASSGESFGSRAASAREGFGAVGAPSGGSFGSRGSATKKRAPLFGPTVFLTLWCMVFWEVVVRKVGLRPAASYASWQAWQELGRFAWPVAVGALAYQLTFRGWAREVGTFARFCWTILLPAVLSAGVLAGAAYWMGR